MTRKATRHELADLLAVGLADLVSKKTDGVSAAVYSGQVADFAKARAAVVVSSGSTKPNILAVANWYGQYEIAVDVFVLYADPDANWDEEMAEDLLDDIVDATLSVLAENQKGENWSALDWNAPSEPSPVSIGGIEYRHEKIILKPS